MKNALKVIFVILFFPMFIYAEAIESNVNLDITENNNSYTHSVDNQSDRVITGYIADVNDVPIVGANIIEGWYHKWYHYRFRG